MLGIYARISKEKEEGKDRSINDQVLSGKELAVNLGLNYEIYIDEGLSGTLDVEERPGLMQLIEDILNKKITHVFAYDQSRLERNKDVWSKLYSIFQDKKIKLSFKDVPEFDFESDENYLFSHITSLMNNFYTKVASRKIKGVLTRNIQEGKAHAIPPYGYTKDNDGYLIIDENEENIVKQIYKSSLKGIGVDSIAYALNEASVPTRYNKINTGTYTVRNKYTGEEKKLEKSKTKWRGGTIRNIIINPIYKGTRIWKGQSYNVPSIISAEHWEEVNSNLSKNANNSGKKVIHRYLLKGLLSCGKCGRNMVGRSRINKKDHYYQCSSKRYKGESCGNKSINIDKIEGIIWARFFKGNDLLNLLQKDLIKDDNKIELLNKDLQRLRKKIETEKKEKTNLINAVAKGLFIDEEIMSRKNQIDSKIKETEILINDIESQIYNAHNSDKLVSNYISEFEHYTTDLSFLQKKEIINKYIKSISVLSHNPNNISIYTLIIKFKINLKDESYIYEKQSNLLMSYSDWTIIDSKFFNPKSTKFISTEDISIIRRTYIDPTTNTVSTPPYNITDDGMIYFHMNSIIPYYTFPKNTIVWTKESICEFYEKYPHLFCKESGVSIMSKDETQEYYKEMVSDYQKFKDKPLIEWLEFIENRSKSS
ncbi:recombinase family protein [Elizabethkingia anophelis]|uniref:recombinase family protein n=1 Tax=Elizabethkingia anophelis TaxID=1117645 RepID=UPI000B360F6E|nr:recombinase family protein [Elizabethkingia anophelis]